MTLPPTGPGPLGPGVPAPAGSAGVPGFTGVLEFQLTDDDLMETATGTPTARALTRRAIRSERVHLTQTVTLVAFSAWTVISTILLDLGVDAPQGVLWLLVPAVLTWLFSGRWAERRWARAYREDLAVACHGHDQTFQFWLDADGLVVRSLRSLERWAWAAIKGVEESSTHLALAVSPLAVILVPRRIGATAVSEFAQAIRARIPGEFSAQAQPALPDAPPDALDAVAYSPTPEEAAAALSWTYDLGRVPDLLLGRAVRSTLMTGAPPAAAGCFLVIDAYLRYGRIVPELAGITLLVLVVMAVWIGIQPVRLKRLVDGAARRRIQVDTRALEVTRVWRTAYGLTVQRPGYRCDFRWDAIATFAATRDRLYIKPWGEGAIAVPRRAAPDRVDRIAAALRQYVPETSSPR